RLRRNRASPASGQSIGDQGTDLFRQSRSEPHQERDHDHRQRFDAPLDGDQDLPARQGRAAGLARSGLRRGQRACRDRRAELFPERRRLSDAGAQESAAAGLEVFPGIAEVTGGPGPGRWLCSRVRKRSRKISEEAMMGPSLMDGFAPALALLATLTAAQAFDEARYPDLKGEWIRVGGNQWDPSKARGLPQQPPLTREYQAVFEASIADQAAGGQGNNLRFTCIPSGMPRVMTGNRGTEIIITAETTYILFANNMPRRIFTDGRDWPSDPEPAFAGYSIGQWIDQDGDGRYDLLEVETRHLKGPRAFDNSGLPLHKDNQTIIKERIYLDRSDTDLLHNDITTIDNALTRPWTVSKTYRRNRNPVWSQTDCGESNNHVVIGKENYYVSADGFLMPARKDQAPPDLKYFRKPQN